MKLTLHFDLWTTKPRRERDIHPDIPLQPYYPPKAGEFAPTPLERDCSRDNTVGRTDFNAFTPLPPYHHPVDGAVDFKPTPLERAPTRNKLDISNLQAFDIKDANLFQPGELERAPTPTQAQAKTSVLSRLARKVKKTLRLAKPDVERRSVGKISILRGNTVKIHSDTTKLFPVTANINGLPKTEVWADDTATLYSNDMSRSSVYSVSSQITLSSWDPESKPTSPPRATPGQTSAGEHVRKGPEQHHTPKTINEIIESLLAEQREYVGTSPSGTAEPDTTILFDYVEECIAEHLEELNEINALQVSAVRDASVAHCKLPLGEHCTFARETPDKDPAAISSPISTTLKAYTEPLTTSLNANLAKRASLVSIASADSDDMGIPASPTPLKRASGLRPLLLASSARPASKISHSRDSGVWFAPGPTHFDRDTRAAIMKERKERLRARGGLVA